MRPRINCQFLQDEHVWRMRQVEGAWVYPSGQLERPNTRDTLREIALHDEVECVMVTIYE